MTLVIIVIVLTAALAFSRMMHAKHARRYAAARLEIARVVVEMDRLMESGKIRLGHRTHDLLYPLMLRSQYREQWKMPWKFWQVPRAHRERWTVIEDEVKNQPEVRKLLERFSKAAWSAYLNKRPVCSLWFILWVTLCFGGLGALFGALLAGHFANEGFRKVKRLVADYYASAMTLRDCSSPELKSC